MADMAEVADMADMADMAEVADMADMAEVPDLADRADMADRANSRVILPPMAYIDGKSEIISHSLAHWPTDSPNYKEMLSHLKIYIFHVCIQQAISTSHDISLAVVITSSIIQCSYDMHQDILSMNTLIKNDKKNHLQRAILVTFRSNEEI